MKLTSFKKLAAVSAVALGVAIAAGHSANALQIGDTSAIPVTATVENTIALAFLPVTGIDFGTIGAIRGGLVDTATMTIPPVGLPVEDPGTGFGGADPAAIVYDPVGVAAPTAVAVTVTAFENTEIYVSYTTCVNPVNGGENFVLNAITDNLTVPGTNDCAGLATIGHGTSDGAGALVFNVGAAISTTTGSSTAYTDGVYTGSFSIVISY